MCPPSALVGMTTENLREGEGEMLYLAQVARISVVGYLMEISNLAVTLP